MGFPFQWAGRKSYSFFCWEMTTSEAFNLFQQATQMMHKEEMKIKKWFRRRGRWLKNLMFCLMVTSKTHHDTWTSAIFACVWGGFCGNCTNEGTFTMMNHSKLVLEESVRAQYCRWNYLSFHSCWSWYLLFPCKNGNSSLWLFNQNGFFWPWTTLILRQIWNGGCDDSIILGPPQTPDLSQFWLCQHVWQRQWSQVE